MRRIPQLPMVLRERRVPRATPVLRVLWVRPAHFPGRRVLWGRRVQLVLRVRPARFRVRVVLRVLWVLPVPWVLKARRVPRLRRATAERREMWVPRGMWVLPVLRELLDRRERRETLVLRVRPAIPF